MNRESSDPQHDIHDVRACRARPDQRVGRREGGVRIVTLEILLRIPARGRDAIPRRSVDDAHRRRRSGRRGRRFRPRAARPAERRPAGTRAAASASSCDRPPDPASRLGDRHGRFAAENQAARAARRFAIAGACEELFRRSARRPPRPRPRAASRRSQGPDRARAARLPAASSASRLVAISLVSTRSKAGSPGFRRFRNAASLDLVQMPLQRGSQSVPEPRPNERLANLRRRGRIGTHGPDPMAARSSPITSETM